MTSSTAKALAVLLLALSPLLAACQTDAPASPSAQAAPAQEAPEAAPPLTRQEAAAQCWMSVEKTHKNTGLDQRADIVTKCINDKMKAAEQPAPAEPKAKPPKSKT